MSDFTVYDVAVLLNFSFINSTYTENKDIPVVCPFCDDKKKRASIRIVKNGKYTNSFKCFHCGQGMGMVDLYINLTGFCGSNKEAYWQIKEKLGLGQMDNNFKFRPQKMENESSDDVVLAEYKADIAIIDDTMRCLMSKLTLSKKHLKHLTDVRCLSQTNIEKFLFRSVPTEEGQTEKLCKSLIENGKKIYGVPCFYKEQNWNLNLTDSMAGIICPVFSIDGYLEGFQIRLDKPFDSTKYLWGSSSKKENGTNSNSPVTFLGDKYDTEVWVIEGILKSAIYHGLTGKTVIGTAGTSNIEPVIETIKKMPKIKLVHEAYDMDKHLRTECHNDYDKKKCRKCKAECKKNGNEIPEGAECPKKMNKVKAISGCQLKLHEVVKQAGYKIIEELWDFETETHLWNGNYKGIDDFEIHKMKEGGNELWQNNCQ